MSMEHVTGETEELENNPFECCFVHGKHSCTNGSTHPSPIAVTSTGTSQLTAQIGQGYLCKLLRQKQYHRVSWIKRSRNDFRKLRR